VTVSDGQANKGCFADLFSVQLNIFQLGVLQKLNFEEVLAKYLPQKFVTVSKTDYAIDLFSLLLFFKVKLN